MTRRHKQFGFTLVEIMIVIAIIGGVLAIGVPKMFNSSTAMRGAIRKMAVMTRDMRNNSRLYTVTTRLAIQIDKEKGMVYRVESSSGLALLTTEDQEKELARLTSSQREGEPTGPKFSQETRVQKKPDSLPKGMIFEDVEKTDRKEIASSGTVYINFYPSGLAEEAAIHLGDGKTLHWTITINPLTGRADVFEKRITLKELKGT